MPGIEFMVIGLPRSGTTWAANWLTGDGLHCHHDPLYTVHYRDWDTRLSIEGAITGISCTGIWRWQEWLSRHPAPKVILHRDIREINASIARLKLPVEDLERGPGALSNIIGYHCYYGDLWEPEKAKHIWDYLFPSRPFNIARHTALRQTWVQPRFETVAVDGSVTRRLVDEMRGFSR